jgi:glycosyltransferase involved in cell wall biosynthesis
LESVFTLENWSQKSLVSQAEKLSGKNGSKNIYHATYYSNLNLNKFRKSNFLTITTIHDLISERFSKKRLVKRPGSNLKKKSLKSASHIICVSNNTKNDLLEYYRIPEDKISVVHLGSDLQPSCPNSVSASRKIPYLLYVGKRNGYKNFEALLHVFSEIKTLKSDFQLVAFGGGEFEILEIDTMKKLGIEKNVFQISGDDSVLSELYEGAFALVYPSLYEGFGLPPIEAMKLGCPVIASNKGSIPEVCEDGAFYFDPLDKDGLAAIIEESLASPELMKQKIVRGRIVSEKYTWKKTALETNEIYKKLTNTA